MLKCETRTSKHKKGISTYLLVCCSVSAFHPNQYCSVKHESVELLTISTAHVHWIVFDFF